MFNKREENVNLSVSSLSTAGRPLNAERLGSEAMQKIESETCGELTIVSPAGRIPNIDQVVARGLRTTVGHTHEGFGEDYFVIKGSLLVVTQGPSDGALAFHTLSEGDRLLIPQNVAHKVLDGSKDNLVLVSSFPRFDIHDEKVSATLERTDFASIMGRLSFDQAEEMEVRSQEQSDRDVRNMAGW